MSLKKKIAAIVAFIAAAVLIFSPVSGAKFSDSKQGRVDASTATLSLGVSDGNNQGTFHLKFLGMAPGDQKEQTFRVTNSGSIPGVASIGEPFTNSTWSGGQLNGNYEKMKVSIPGHLEPTSVGSLPARVELGVLAPGETKEYRVRMSLDQAAGNEWQGVQMGTTLTVLLEQQ